MATSSFQSAVVLTYPGYTDAYIDIVAGADGQYYMACIANGMSGVMVKQWDGLAWQDYTSFTAAQAGDTTVNEDLDLVIDKDGQIHVAYRGVTGRLNKIKYGSFDGDSWTFSQVESTSDPQGWKDLQDPRLVIDADGHAHMVYVYTDANGSRVYSARYATNESGSWVSQEIVRGTGPIGLDEIHMPKIIVKDDNSLVITYVREDSQNDFFGNIYMMTKPASGTLSAAQKVVNSTGDGQNHVGETFVDANGHIHIFYSADVYNNDMSVVSSVMYEKTNASGQWVTTKLGSSSSLSLYGSDYQMVNGVEYLLYTELQPKDYAFTYEKTQVWIRHPGSEWVQGNTVPVSPNTYDITMGVQPDNTVMVVNLDKNQKVISYHTGDAGGPVQPEVLSVSGLSDLSLMENALNNTPVFLADKAVVTGTPGVSFDGGSLYVGYTASSVNEETLAIRHQGFGAGQVGVDGLDVSYDGVVIGTIVEGFDGALGMGLVIYLNDNATAAGIQAVLRNISYQNSSNTPDAVQSILVSINDSSPTGYTETTANLTITAENDAPSVSGDQQMEVLAGQAVQVTTVDLNMVDGDGDAITYHLNSFWEGHVTVNGVEATTFTQAQLEAGVVYFVSNGEMPLGIFGGYAVDGNGGSTPFNVNVTVFPSNQAPTIGGDGAVATTEGGLVTITTADLNGIDPDNQPEDLVYTVTAEIRGTILVNGQAVDSFTQADLVAGKVQFQHDGSAHTNQAFFQVNLTDGGAGTTPVTRIVSVQVANVSKAPVAASQIVPINEDSPYAFSADVFGFQDPNENGMADAFTAIIVETLPQKGQLTFLDGPVLPGQVIPAVLLANLVYAPAAGQSGVGHGSFTFRVFDGGTADNGGQNISQQSYTFTFDVTSINDAPLASDNTIRLLEDGMHTFQAADFGFLDTDGNAFASVEIVSLPWQGMLFFNNAPVAIGQSIPASAIGSLVFVPNVNGNGDGLYTGFQFRVKDDGGTANGGSDTSATHTINVQVTPVNDAPLSQDGTVSAVEDTPYRFSLADFAFSDQADATQIYARGPMPVGGNALKAVIITTLPQHGALTLNGQSVVVGQSINAGDIDNLVFTSADNANGNGYATIKFRVQDDGGLENGGQDTSAEHMLSIDLAPVNDAPTAQNNTVAVLEDGTYSFSAVDFGFSDIDGNKLQGVVITELPANGILTFQGQPVVVGQTIGAMNLGSLVFSPAHDANGAGYASFKFRVQDNGGTQNNGVDTSAEQTITLDVTPVNDAPAANFPTITLLEDGSHIFSAADFGFTDTEGHAFISVVIADLPWQGTLALDGVAVAAGQEIAVADLGKLVFTPEANGNGAYYAGFSFQVRDSGGTANGGADTSATHSLHFTVTAVNDAPTSADGAVTLIEDTAYAFSLSDFAFSDAADAVSPIYTLLRLPPPPSSADALLAIIVTELPASGTLTFDGQPVAAGQAIGASEIGKLVFTPARDAHGTGYASFTFKVQDDGGTATGGVNTSAEHTLTIDVTPVNDAPVAANDGPVILIENATVTADAAQGVLANDSDVDPDVLAVAAVGYGGRTVLAGQALAGLYGTLTLHADGSYGYVADQAAADALKAGESRPEVFTYTISDGAGATHAASLTFTVNGAADAATFTGTATGAVRENGPFVATGTLATADRDAGETGFQAQGEVQGSYGTFAFDAATGAWTYVLNATAAATKALRSGEVKTETFTVRALDGTATAVSVQVTGYGVLVDGVEITTETVMHADGSSAPVTTIPVVTSARTEMTGQAGVADIPLVSVGGQTVLLAQLPVGYGLQVGGSAAPQPAGSALADLIREINAHTASGSADQSQLIGNGASFLNGLSGTTPLLVQTIVPTVAPGSASVPGQPLVLSGMPAASAPMTALVIDTSGLPSASHIELQNVSFAVVIGAATITGGAGAQVVYGDGASQTIFLGADDDELHGGGGDDWVGSQGGHDWLYGDAGNDTVSGGEGNDRLFGGTGHDWLDGGVGADRLDGGEGNDRLLGGTGTDTLLGGEGNDLIRGEAGHDRITGGLGRDKMWGGQGRDVFDFNAVKESKVGAQRDVIHDFRSGQDRIDLRDIDANTRLKGNQQFAWAGSDGPFLFSKESAAFLKAGFTGKAGELRYAGCLLMGDVNGDGRADFQIKIIGTFAAGDVIL